MAALFSREIAFLSEARFDLDQSADCMNTLLLESLAFRYGRALDPRGRSPHA